MINDLETISRNMRRWNKKRYSIAFLNTFFTQNQGFNFIPDKEFMGSDNMFIHVYPAITDDQEFIFYLIAADHDNENTTDWVKVVRNVKIKPMSFPVVHSELKPGRAKGMFDLWNEEYKTWIEHNATAGNIYQALIVPPADINIGVKYQVYFALSVVGPDQFDADLVVYNETDNLIEYPNIVTGEYSDTVMPCPPLEPNGGDILYLRDLIDR